ncbi:hypothetical protein GGI12_000858 [Dipsacomyces acuminosporus]|nr:hypothetical protein GGI12_000858 [Dipsacomyces acuminosporus]
MPPSDLINVRQFRDKFAGLVRNQKDHNIFNAQSEWSEEAKEEVANRCKIAEDLSFSNAAFVNPTLFHMLRQHREFNEASERKLLQRKKEIAIELEKKRMEKLNGDDATETQIEQHQQQAGDGSSANGNINISSGNGNGNGNGNGSGGGEYGDGSMLLAVDVHGDTPTELDPLALQVDKNTVDDAMARLVNVTANIEQADNIADGQDEQGGDEQGGDEQGSSNGAIAENADEPFAESAEKDGNAVADTQPESPKKPGPRNLEDVTLHTPEAELPKGITHDMLKKAIANSGFKRSTDVPKDTKRETKTRAKAAEPPGVSELEGKFLKVKTLLDESTLASLRETNRRMVPSKYRLEVNFLTNRVQPEPSPDFTPVADDEVILSVCLFNNRSPTSKMEEYLVLGSQSLTVLRDAFYCISDFLVSQRDEQNENTKDRKVSSSYFFIEKTFYNDMRSPSATDYSRVIMEWASDPERQEKNHKFRGLQSRLMDGARFLDLSIRLRQPYIFMHQGDCEHTLMFTDLRLLGPKDDQFVENYPKQIFRTRHMRHKCRMCSAYPAQYVTKNDFHSGMSPCYFCEKCYVPFHYSVDNQRLLDHDCFPYANVNLI